jgi:hypothetical protein
MENEDEPFRPAPSRPYQPGNTQLRVPAPALTATLSLLQRAGRRESGLFWYGPRDEIGNGRVAYIVAPRQRMSWGNFSVSAGALAEVVHRLPDDWKPLAQIHSHPGHRVEHSTYDDRMASSRRALSLVFPSYGHVRENFPGTIGIHEFQNDYWYLLDAANAARRVTVCGGAVKVDDLR